MNGLQLTVRLQIHDGKFDEFKEIAGQCVKSVRDNDYGTLQYDWFISEDKTECIVREAYRDSAAFFAHISNLGYTTGALRAVCDIDLEMFGSPSGELTAVIEEMGGRIYHSFMSI